MHARSSILSLLVLTVLVGVACGGGPSTPSAAEGVSLDGTAVGLPGLAADQAAQQLVAILRKRRSGNIRGR